MNLKETREAQGLTQRAFARQIGSPVPDYNKIERGRFLPTPELLGRICRALDKRPLELYERQEIDLLGAMGMAPGRRSADRHNITAARCTGCRRSLQGRFRRIFGPPWATPASGRHIWTGGGPWSGSTKKERAPPVVTTPARHTRKIISPSL